MESSRNMVGWRVNSTFIIKGGQNGVKSQLSEYGTLPNVYYKGGAKWSQVATRVVGRCWRAAL